MDTLIEIQNLTKHFGSLKAVNGISFSVQRGEVLGFLGPNGAGKSTTMKMLTGFLTPSSGSIEVAGHSVLKDAIKAQEAIGYLPEGAPLYPDMTPAGLLRFISAIRGLKGAAREARIATVIGQVHIEGVLHQSIETLSKGFKRRVGLALAILHDPEILILDEPTDGLDPNQKHEVRELICEMSQNKAIVLSTHILEEVDAVCTRAIIIDRGTVVADGTPADLRARASNHNVVHITLRSSDNAVESQLRELPNVQSMEQVAMANGMIRYELTPLNRMSIIDGVSELVRAKNWEALELVSQPGSLNELFREVTDSDLRKNATSTPQQQPQVSAGVNA
ncbi:MAG: ABC-2 type transport system ATP-binding protein [Planctomycetota bacterium]|jgi:ABC-2 type transport system ATP-binding protein